MIENYLRKRENLVNVFVLIDSRHTPQKNDLEFLEQLAKWDVPFTLIFTKADKETQATVSKNVKSFLEKMRLRNREHTTLEKEAHKYNIKYVTLFDSWRVVKSDSFWSQLSPDA